jgi:hypothetical protein
LSILGNVSFVLEEYGEMRELTQMEQDAVAGGNNHGSIFIVPISVGSNDGNGNVNTSGVIQAGNFVSGGSITQVGNTSVSSVSINSQHKW